MAKLTQEEAAHALGMKLREIVDLVPVRGGTVVVTPDGYQTLVAEDGTLSKYERPPLAESGEAVADEEPAAPAAARSRR